MVIEKNFRIKDKRWKGIVDNIDLSTIFSNVIKVLGYKIPKNKVIEISVIYTNDKDIQKINSKYRGIDKPTNVLSFPIYENEFINALNYEDYLLLGDIILSFDTIQRESSNFNKHLIHLIVHSILHLFGFDHQNNSDAEIMENYEIKILNLMNIENPYL